MNHIASPKDKTKLIISDDGVNNALIFEYSDNILDFIKNIFLKKYKKLINYEK